MPQPSSTDPAAGRIVCGALGCDEPTTSFPPFPTIVGFCFGHGDVLRRFLSLIDCAGPVGFDGQRAAWEISRRRDGVDA